MSVPPTPPASMATARGIADAVLYAGYLLYPYRASAGKNQLRWQFGVLVPTGYARAGAGEHSDLRTECLLAPGVTAMLHLQLRFLQLARRPASQPAATGAATTRGWDEGLEQSVEAVIPVAELAGEGQLVPFTIPAGTDHRAGIARVREELRGELRLRADPLPGPCRLLRLRVEVANTSDWAPAHSTREPALRHSLVATHTLLAVNDGEFLSLLDPPEWARPAARDCQNLRTFPVLVGDPAVRDAVLSSPIILYDYPRVAPQTPGNLCDRTEIDERLGLRTVAPTTVGSDLVQRGVNW